MGKQDIIGASKLRTIIIALGALVCIASMGYGFYVIQTEAAAEGEYRQVADEMRLRTHQIVDLARQGLQGEESTYSDLDGQIAAFDQLLPRIQIAELSKELSQVEVSWQPVKRAAQVLIDTAPLSIFANEVASKLESSVRPMQQELATVVSILGEKKASAQTVGAAQKTLWLSERIARNIDRLVAGGGDVQSSAREIRSDAGEFINIVEALTRGDSSLGIQKVTDAKAIESLSEAFSLFSIVSTSVERIAGSSAELGQAVAARNTILSSGAPLSDAVTDLIPAFDSLAVGRLDDRATLLALFVAPAMLAIGLLLAMYIDQSRRAKKTEAGVEGISAALVKIAEGDLTVRVAEDELVTAEIAREINAATGRQGELIRFICKPFKQSVDEIGKIGISAGAQVDKGQELTRSVTDSIDAATEMVRASEEIKTSTTEAARTSDRNCQQVAQGYELTKDMSEASADVRESVQETSKSAKRQSELIQSVTAAAEYIQALNTKISVVAINTRIEAEKAGEYGRPFLGIAEAIADLLREAGDEARKIISEVRMLQNMSAENLASMETTVGTVVTILEYIDRLDSSLEEINSGSTAISSIIRSVDDAAGQSAESALHMNSSMAEIRERSVEIGKASESTQQGVNSLQQSMRTASERLARFRTDESAAMPEADLSEPDELERIRAATKVYREEDMSALESAQRARASV